VKNNVQAFARAGAVANIFSSGGYRVTEGDIILIKQLGTSASYTFQINENARDQVAGEIRLRQGDAFLPQKVGYYLMKAGAAAASVTTALLAVAQLHSYPNTSVFANGAEAANLESIYRGSWAMNVNNVDVYQFLDMGRYRRVDTAQQGVQASQQAAAVGTGGAYQRSAWTGPDYGMHPFNTDVAFTGLLNQSVRVSLIDAINNNIDASASTNYLVCKFRGLYAYNAASDVADITKEVFQMKPAATRLAR
jgi:hypothetical protein